MKPLHTSARMILALVATTALTACADQGEMMRGGRVGPYGSMGGGMMSGSSGGQTGMMQSDKKSMCDMFEQMTHGQSPEERAALLDERMKDMSPEMRQQHMQMMNQQCK